MYEDQNWGSKPGTQSRLFVGKTINKEVELDRGLMIGEL